MSPAETWLALAGLAVTHTLVWLHGRATGENWNLGEVVRLRGTAKRLRDERDELLQVLAVEGDDFRRWDQEMKRGASS